MIYQNYFQGSRQIDNVSRRYYERELGAGIGPSPTMRESFGYTEPFRRFVQREDFSLQANALKNEMPSWLLGDDYLTNFKTGDPYIKVDEGYARLPGAGYEAIHPELKGLNPEDYPDIHKLAILGDVAPYSREYNIFRQKVGNDSQDSTELRIEYEKILDRVRQTRESVIRMENQGSPSCRTQNPSRARAGERPWLRSLPFSALRIAPNQGRASRPTHPLSGSRYDSLMTPAVCFPQPSVSYILVGTPGSSWLIGRQIFSRSLHTDRCPTLSTKRVGEATFPARHCNLWSEMHLKRC